MAFYAELIRRRWFCVSKRDAIYIYSKILYDEWYATLSEGDKRKLEKQKQKRELQEQREVEDVISELCIMNRIVSDLGRFPYKVW
jgi:hypothetical protein